MDTFLLHPVAREMYRSPASGREEVRWLGRKDKPVRVPIYTARPSVIADRPAAYWIPGAKVEVIDRLRRHGLEMETLSSPRTVRVELVRMTGGRHDPAAEKEGRFPFTADGYEPLQREVTYVPGSVRVSTDQPLGELAREFNAKLVADPQFAADGDARLAWFYERTPFYDPNYAIYPVGREVPAATQAVDH